MTSSVRAVPFVAAVLACHLAVAAYASPPNIIIITSDDHPWPAYGFMQQLNDEHEFDTLNNFYSRSVHPKNGKNPKDAFETPSLGTTSPMATTPGIDTLAARGFLFPAGHAAASVCHPSFQAVLTGRYQRDFQRGRFNRPYLDPAEASGIVPTGVPKATTPKQGLTAHYPYYFVEYLNDALAATVGDESTGEFEYAGTSLAPQYRALGFGKIWNDPRKSASGYFNTGFDCGLRNKSVPRHRLDEMIEFMRGNQAVELECTTLNSAPSPNPQDHWHNENQPAFVWYATNLPHTPGDGAVIISNTPDTGSGCVPGAGTNCIKKPTFGAPGDRDQAVIDLKERLARIADNPEVRDPGYTANILLLDYWVGELLAFLNSEDDPRNPGHPLIENTLVLYWSDNGFKLPNSKRSIGENGYRTPIIMLPPQAEFSQGIAPRPASDYSPVLAQASVLDFVATSVGHATSGVVEYRTCEVAESVGSGPPQPVRSVQGTKMCRNRSTGTFNVPWTDPSCGCLPGIELTDLAVDRLLRDQLVGEKRSKNGQGKDQYLRVLWEPPSGSNLCKLDGTGASARCHLRVRQKKNDDCENTVQVFDLLNDPDEKLSLETEPGQPDALPHDDLVDWATALDQFETNGPNPDATSCL